MNQNDNVDYKKLYHYLFNLISWLQKRIIETADETDESAKEFVLQLQMIQLLAEDKYLELSEES